MLSHRSFPIPETPAGSTEVFLFSVYHTPYLCIFIKPCHILQSVFQSWTKLHHSGSISLTGLTMTSALGYQCQVSVETIFHRSEWLLTLTMSISDCLYSSWTKEHSTLDLPVADLNGPGNPQTIAQYFLFPSGERPKWQAIGTVPVASLWCPPKFTVTFWHRSGAKRGGDFKLGEWEVTVSGTSTVSRQMSSRGNSN